MGNAEWSFGHFFCEEKRPSEGEDGCPVLIMDATCSLIAVFDGLGGSGAQKYTIDGANEQTGARIASNVVSKIIKEETEAYFDYPDRDLIDYIAGLQRLLKSELERLANIYHVPSRVKSGLLRIFPTTMAMAFCRRDNEENIITSVWSGDSRIYCLDRRGLKLLTTDDIDTTENHDELDFGQDGVITNCICADKDFTLNTRRIRCSASSIVFSMTDGCFGYFKTPIHFEYELIDSILSSSSAESFSENFRKKLINISADDFSMAFVGFKASFIDMANSLEERFECVRGIKAAYDNFIKLDEALGGRSQNGIYREDLLKIWSEYKSHYMSEDHE